MGILTGNNSNGPSCAVVLKCLGGLGQRSTGVCHVVDQDRNLVLDLTDQDHGADDIRPRPLLVDQREGAT